MVEILPKTAWNPKQSIKQTIHNKIWRTSANLYYLRYQWLFTQIRRKKWINDVHQISLELK